MVCPNFDSKRNTNGIAGPATKRAPGRAGARSTITRGRRAVRHVRRWRLTQGMVEAAVLFLVVALLLVYVGTVIGERMMRPRDVPVVAVEVQPGDTLWSLAERYGYPNEYILKRVDRLSAYNHLTPGTRLQPGQVIQVPVENPAERERVLASNASVE